MRRRGATYQLRPPRISRCSRGTREHGTLLTVSREEAQHASLLRARAVPRWLWSVGALGKGSAPTRGPSPSARGRGATYQLRPPRISSLFRGTRKRATALTVSREKAQYASLLCARAVPRCSWSVHPLGKGIITPAGGFSLSTRGRGATHQLRPPRTSRCSRGRRERATALAVSREEAQHASMLRARAVPRCS